MRVGMELSKEGSTVGLCECHICVLTSTVIILL